MKNGYKFSISVAVEPLPDVFPIVYTGDIYNTIDKVKSIGYDAIELQLRDPELVDANSIKKYCDKNGIEISGLCTGLEYNINRLSMIDDDVEKRNELRRKMFLHIEMCALFECPIVVGCIRGNLPYTGDVRGYIERFREELIMLSGKAKDCGVEIYVEAINFYVNNYLNTLKQTSDFIDSLGCDNIKVHIDTHHMAIEEYDMVRAIHYVGNKIGYVHFSENNRLYPGAGSMDFLSVMQTLKEVGYNGYYGVEIVPLPDKDICATKALEYLCKLTDLVEYEPLMI